MSKQLQPHDNMKGAPDVPANKRKASVLEDPAGNGGAVFTMPAPRLPASLMDQDLALLQDFTHSGIVGDHRPAGITDLRQHDVQAIECALTAILDAQKGSAQDFADREASSFALIGNAVAKLQAAGLSRHGLEKIRQIAVLETALKWDESDAESDSDACAEGSVNDSLPGEERAAPTGGGAQGWNGARGRERRAAAPGGGITPPADAADGIETRTGGGSSSFGRDSPSSDGGSEESATTATTLEATSDDAAQPDSYRASREQAFRCDDGHECARTPPDVLVSSQSHTSRGS
jgi:hypothetical protein